MKLKAILATATAMTLMHAPAWSAVFDEEFLPRVFPGATISAAEAVYEGGQETFTAITIKDREMLLEMHGVRFFSEAGQGRVGVDRLNINHVTGDAGGLSLRGISLYLDDVPISSWQGDERGLCGFLAHFTSVDIQQAVIGRAVGARREVIHSAQQLGMINSANRLCRFTGYVSAEELRFGTSDGGGRILQKARLRADLPLNVSAARLGPPESSASVEARLFIVSQDQQPLLSSEDFKAEFRMSSPSLAGWIYTLDRLAANPATSRILEDSWNAFAVTEGNVTLSVERAQISSAGFIPDHLISNFTAANLSSLPFTAEVKAVMRGGKLQIESSASGIGVGSIEGAGLFTMKPVRSEPGSDNPDRFWMDRARIAATDGGFSMSFAKVMGLPPDLWVRALLRDPMLKIMGSSEKSEFTRMVERYGSDAMPLLAGLGRGTPLEAHIQPAEPVLFRDFPDFFRSILRDGKGISFSLKETNPAPAE